MANQFEDLLTKAVHGDNDTRCSSDRDVAPPLHTTTINLYGEPSELQRADPSTGTPAVYSRIGHHNTDRVESVLSELLDGHAVAYSSGLSAFHAVLLLVQPKRLFIGDGYHGIHGVAHLVERSGLEVFPLSKISELAEKNDIVHLETPVNPTGLAFDIAHYAEIAHAKGAKLVVDATFAPPPLTDPFKFGTDIVLHSASKFLGGHSDILAGVLVTKDPAVAAQLKKDRTFIGTILAPLEAWLLLRSLKTYPLRLEQQSRNVNAVVKFLAENQSKLSKLTKIYSSNLQKEPFVAEQLPLGAAPTFSIEVTDEQTAKTLPSKLKYFYHSTSLGSVHSLIEWRAVTDPSVAPNLLRISIGIERTEDLIADLESALK